MKKSYPFYKIIISYFNLKAENDGDRHTDKVIVFQEDKPINSRKKAIERFRSLEDIFVQAKKQGDVLSSITEIIDESYTAGIIPTLNLYICENDNEEEDLVLFGSLLENAEERLLELTDEYEYYLANNIDHEGIEIYKNEEGEIFKILKDSLMIEEDFEDLTKIIN